MAFQYLTSATLPYVDPYIAYLKPTVFEHDGAVWVYILGFLYDYSAGVLTRRSSPRTTLNVYYSGRCVSYNSGLYCYEITTAGYVNLLTYSSGSWSVAGSHTAMGDMANAYWSDLVVYNGYIYVCFSNEIFRYNGSTFEYYYQGFTDYIIRPFSYFNSYLLFYVFRLTPPYTTVMTFAGTDLVVSATNNEGGASLGYVTGRNGKYLFPGGFLDYNLSSNTVTNGSNTHRGYVNPIFSLSGTDLILGNDGLTAYIFNTGVYTATSAIAFNITAPFTSYNTVEQVNQTIYGVAYHSATSAIGLFLWDTPADPPILPSDTVVSFNSSLIHSPSPAYIRLEDLSVLSAVTSDTDYLRMWRLTNNRSGETFNYLSYESTMEVSVSGIYGDTFDVSLSAVW